ncbi:hypothetical protein DCW30_01845 [Streptomyces alfalfae]|uniref:Lipoprotein n=1 Tax=Streptomyces alfalfae TaxID=1642299 RepID=A0ABM6GSA5_9ACTN|nr:hypothetical protein [Streptomyces alfalfae]APY86621.1 hypothetical protein A7J05_13635 [Streptomyces alfalfae]AYA17009.1 hypothetical protein D3X13_12880 [Streptomyces fradiae]RXX47751.1 hypothetical protein DCW30_01845 [Streptomyces alfalfae]RZN00571.1 hypothetical protein D4104_08840 [Streptomyces alfalfae]
MNSRRTLTARRAMTAVAITTGLVLTLAGCGGGDDGNGKAEEPTSSASSGQKDSGGDEKGQTDKPSGGQALAEAKDGDINVKINSALRDGGGFVTVSGTVTNNGGRSWMGADWASDERELRSNGGSLSGASLVDKEGKKKYLVLRDTSGRCLCTKFNGRVRQGDTANWFAQFPAPPEGTSKVTFQVGSMPPAPIELSDGE